MRFESGKHTLWCCSVCPPLIFFRSFHILHSQRPSASIRYFYLHSHLLLFASFALVNSDWPSLTPLLSPVSPPVAHKHKHPNIRDTGKMDKHFFYSLIFKLYLDVIIHHFLLWKTSVLCFFHWQLQTLTPALSSGDISSVSTCPPQHSRTPLNILGPPPLLLNLH